MLPHPLPEELAELIARRFRAIGEPLRVRLLDLLRDGELGVSELAEQLDAGQQNISKHLGVLADAGMLARRKQGNHVYYRIADEDVFALCEQVCGSLQSQLSSLAALVGSAHVGRSSGLRGAGRWVTRLRGIERGEPFADPRV